MNRFPGVEAAPTYQWKEEEESKRLEVVRDSKRKASAILVEEGEEDDDALESEGSGEASVSYFYYFCR